MLRHTSRENRFLVCLDGLKSSVLSNNSGCQYSYPILQALQED